MLNFHLILGACLAVVFSIVFPRSLHAGEPILIGYVGQERQRPPVLSNFEEYPDDEGVAGAQLGIDDNNTTGKFTGQFFELSQSILKKGENADQVIASLVSKGVQFIILDLPSSMLDSTLKKELPLGITFFNVSAEDRRFRDQDCHPQLLHTTLSRDMKTDALAQFLVKKRWKSWFVVTSERNEDKLYLSAIERSAKKFGAKIVKQKTWDGNFDARRAASAEVPLFTRGVDYDVLMVADEIGDFGNYLLFQTFDPRPVAGTQGLIASAWGRPLEQWGAAQLQERFLAQSSRWMRPRDYAAWLAVRAIGEGALRSKSAMQVDIDAYLRSDDFQLAGFKGRKMSFRKWNGQMRQPVPLMWSSALVAQTPVEGFLHQHTELDTLGIDAPESKCSYSNK